LLSGAVAVTIWVTLDGAVLASDWRCVRQAEQKFKRENERQNNLNTQRENKQKGKGEESTGILKNNLDDVEEFMDGSGENRRDDLSQTIGIGFNLLSNQ
jgi:hypothetical protein